MATIMINIVKRARKIAERRANKQSFPYDLEGYCARGSAILWRELQKNGISAKICVADDNNECHVFLKVRHQILDITATQFGWHAVIVRSCRGLKEWYWRESYSFKTIEDLIAYQKRTGWPTEQVAELS
jgi:hypothetical protein